ncbi:hypothetical protein EN866_33150 [Mesorhizobium sp. M2D.F.Ca.ET.223.01.1.1]|uniref:hypothetical protein n=1 Tax=Mesorhizobium sp. M2D.F.Ca.ET.223.01.1.1 TaxID=2563940 RepID=UPI00109310E4|nr:hypothetical protein [Mesorhizobium sp. M2D.F.Ca.ET.223.01.1.1]TGR84559.1 hypothetical protein EN866_33150 [Mesorhizobium sp. M2D.F.Ca.ET.223.01.1.1]TGT65969.1 hypothetical protein EN802_30650 [bacterium M00.F.Ca.ET.159.01.1.1]TGT79654.1 hypothetical protein EN800_29990 [bacterium M00.F.Ca.ET.157.01.1.1]
MTDDEIAAKLSKIGKGVALAEAETTPDKKDLQEEEDLERQKKLAHVKNEWMLIGLREKYGENIINFLWTYFVFAMAVLIFHAYHVGGFNLPESVLTAIVGATAVSVLGVVGTVAAGLFKPPLPPKD